MKAASPRALAEARLVEFVRTNEALRAEIERLRANYNVLSGQLAVVVTGSESDRERRLAALNLMEDAVYARRAEQQENEVRRRVEGELREANARQDDLLVTLRQSERALQEAAARQALLLLHAREAQAQAEEANRAKDEFLATLSHELRTPLAAILLWAGALRAGGRQSHDLDRAIRAIAESAESQSRLIEDLLDLSRLTAGKVHLAPASVAVGALVQAALERVRPAAESKGQTLALSIDASLGDAWLDGGRLKQVLGNLLSNATKFTPAGGTIALSAQRHKGRLEIQISDDGEGISPEFMPHIFERFRQADVGETRAYPGLGIGLALSRQLIDLQKGSIVATSSGIGQGSVFHVSLPWIDAPGVSTALPAVTTAPSAAKSLADVTVLLVEDDANTSAAMVEVLEGSGAMVLACGTAPDALARIDSMSAKERRSFVVVSDLGLPGMSGFELIRRIVSRDQGPSWHAVPACAVSALARDVDRERALEAGFDIYIAKPVSPQQLIDAVRDLQDIGARLGAAQGSPPSAL